MSSWLSTTTQKAKEAIGAATRTVDPDVEGLTLRIKHIEADVVLLRKTLETSCLSVTQHAPRARAQMLDVMLRMGASLVQGSEEHYAAFREGHAIIDGSGAEKLQDLFSKVVLTPLDEWLATFSDVKATMADLNTARVTYDHYRGKLKDLEEAKRALQLKGKVVDGATEEKMSRNKDKLKEVRAGMEGARARPVLPPFFCGFSPSPCVPALF